MRVVLATSIPRGGPIEHALMLGRDLARREIAVTAVVATRPLADRFALAGVEPVLLPLERRLDVAAWQRLRALAGGAGVVHSHDRLSGLWARVLPRSRPATAFVHTVHGLPEPYLPPPVGRQHPGLRALLAYRGVERMLAARADALLVPSRATAEVLHERLGYPRDRITVVPNGVDQSPRPGLRGELVGTLSLLEPVKGIDVFLRAAAGLAAIRPGLRFAVHGDGTQAREMKALARRLGIADRVSFPGIVAAEDALAQLGVLVVTSWFESGAYSVLEAMAAGVPVVATRVGGIPEMAPEWAVELVEPGDVNGVTAAVLRLLDDPGLAARRARAGMAAAAEQSAARTADATLTIYERVLSQRRT